jgi:hypothetical protein
LAARVPGGGFGTRLPTGLPPRFVHGTALPRNWADRSDDIRALEALLYREDIRVLNVVALGGTGKTVLMRRIADSAFEAAAGFDAMMWFSFYRDDDVEHFFLEACRYLIADFDPTRYTSTFERAAVLQQVVEARSVLFVLDGFERLVSQPRHGSAAGRIDRAELASFLSFVLSARTRTTVALTSRLRLDDFADAAGYHEHDLPDLRLRPRSTTCVAAASAGRTGC